MATILHTKMPVVVGFHHTVVWLEERHYKEVWSVERHHKVVGLVERRHKVVWLVERRHKVVGLVERHHTVVGLVECHHTVVGLVVEGVVTVSEGFHMEVWSVERPWRLSGREGGGRRKP